MQHLTRNNFPRFHYEKFRKVSNGNLPHILYRVSFPYTIIPCCCGVSQQKAEMTFCLTGYDAYGFDLDHTLAKYKLTELCRVCICQRTKLTTISYMPTLERLKAGGGGSFFQKDAKWCILLHFGYKICVVKTLNIV